MTDTESLFEKLKSMGVQLGASHIPPPEKKAPIPSYGIESILPGEETPTIYGKAFLVREEYPRDYLHGRFYICEDQPMDVLSAWSGVTRISQPGSQNVVFLDTETSGLAGGTGTYAFLVGIGYRTLSGFELIQFFMRDPGEEEAVLAALQEWLQRFDVVVTFNGKTFDVPLLNTRYLLNGMATPFTGYEHLDVLQIARKLWRDRLPSRALGDLEKEIIQYERNEEEVPGWMIPQLYFDYLRTGDARPISGVFYHNARDILSLAALYGYVANLLANPADERLNGYSLDMAAIARLFEEMGRLDQSIELYEKALSFGDMPEENFFKTIDRFALLQKRHGNWEKAVDLWKKAAVHGHSPACIELSKYYEHQARNNYEALIWAKKGLDCLEVQYLYRYSEKTVQFEIERRIGRLVKKMYG
jgi:uncharacterized protein YprB with RNaseH-like and TPR domain